MQQKSLRHKMVNQTPEALWGGQGMTPAWVAVCAYWPYCSNPTSGGSRISTRELSSPPPPPECNSGELKAALGAGPVCAARAARQHTWWLQNV